MLGVNRTCDRHHESDANDLEQKSQTKKGPNLLYGRQPTNPKVISSNPSGTPFGKYIPSHVSVMGGGDRLGLCAIADPDSSRWVKHWPRPARACLRADAAKGWEVEGRRIWGVKQVGQSDA